MANLKQLRIRIKSIVSTKKITKVMQMVSSAKLRKAKRSAIESLNYAKDLLEMVQIITHNYTLSGMQDLTKLEQKALSTVSENKQHLLIVLTSDRGLCGGFNNTLLRSVNRNISQYLQNNEKFKLIIIGKKGYDFFKKIYPNNIASHYIITKVNSLELIHNITKEVCELLQNDEINDCIVCFNASSTTANISFQNIFPVPMSLESQNLIEYELEGSSLLDSAIRSYIEGQLYYNLQVSKAAEEFARVMAMDNATINAGNMINDLTLLLNRSRQANITKELNEIISGAEAL